MKKAFILAGGAVKDHAQLAKLISPDDLVIAADSGYHHAIKMGVHVTALVGDMDSIGNIPTDVDVVSFPTRKDFTDSELAIEHSKDLGATNITIMGATGTRLDHSLTNILSLVHSGATIVDEYNTVSLLNKARNCVTLSEPIGTTVSLVPLSQCIGVTTDGLEYRLANETLDVGFGRSISNVMENETATITITDGQLLVIVVKGE